MNLSLILFLIGILVFGWAVVVTAVLLLLSVLAKYNTKQTKKKKLACC